MDICEQDKLMVETRKRLEESPYHNLKLKDGLINPNGRERSEQTDRFDSEQSK